MVSALKHAVELWDEPQSLINLWDTLPSKKEQEDLVSIWLKHIVDDYKLSEPVIADIGCGVGRYVDPLDHVTEFGQYYGYDNSVAMIAEAKQLYEDDNVEFSFVDAFNFQSDIHYDIAISIDVAHHQDEPVVALTRIMRNFRASHYLLTLLVGNRREDLYNSTIVSFTEFLKLCDDYTIQRMHIQRFDDNQFAWVMVHITK